MHIHNIDKSLVEKAKKHYNETTGKKAVEACLLDLFKLEEALKYKEEAMRYRTLKKLLK